MRRLDDERRLIAGKFCGSPQTFLGHATRLRGARNGRAQGGLRLSGRGHVADAERLHDGGSRHLLLSELGGQTVEQLERLRSQELTEEGTVRTVEQLQQLDRLIPR